MKFIRLNKAERLEIYEKALAYFQYLYRLEYTIDQLPGICPLLRRTFNNVYGTNATTKDLKGVFVEFESCCPRDSYDYADLWWAYEDEDGVLIRILVLLWCIDQCKK